MEQDMLLSQAQAERYANLMNKFSIGFFSPPDDIKYALTTLEHLTSDLPPSAQLVSPILTSKNTYSLASVFEFNTTNNDASLAIRRAFMFAADGMYFCIVLPSEDDIKMNLAKQIFSLHYSQRAAQIYSQIIKNMSKNVEDSLRELLGGLASELSEEILSGDLYDRAASIEEEKIALLRDKRIEDTEMYYQPQYYVEIPLNVNLSVTPIETNIVEDIKIFKIKNDDKEELLSENIAREAGELLKNTCIYSADFLEAIRKQYIHWHEEPNIPIYEDLGQHSLEIVSSSASINYYLRKIDQWIEEKRAETDSLGETAATDLNRALIIAKRRIRTYLAGIWGPKLLADALQLLIAKNKEILIKFISEFIPEDSEVINIDEEAVLRLATTDLDKRFLDAMSESQKRTIQSIRSAIGSKLLDEKIIEEFRQDLTIKMIEEINLGNVINPEKIQEYIINQFQKYAEQNGISLAVLDAIKQSASSAREELKQLIAKPVTDEDIQGIQDYLMYWGAACISGGTLLNRGTSRVESAEGSFLLSFSYLPERGVCCGVIGREDKKEGEKEKSLFGLIKKLSINQSSMERII